MEKKLIQFWKVLKSTQLGRWLFSLLLGFVVPYSGSISAIVLELEKGKAKVELKEKWAIRNHLKSIHAIALVNLGELASGLAMLAALPANSRGIVKAINIEYHKKARGTLIATGYANPPSELKENIEQFATAEILDSLGEKVASVKVTWQVGPRGE